MSTQIRQRDHVFTDADFEHIRVLLYGYSGINLNKSKINMVYNRLRPRLRATGMPSVANYLELVEQDYEGEFEKFVNSLTTNLTSFFREAHHFPILKKHVTDLRKKPVRLWCSAASTGEEPYTMAMTMIEAFGSYTPPVEIVATDIDTNVLAKATKGVYSLDSVKSLPPETLKRYFLRGTGANANFVQVRKELRDMIRFQPLNLLDEHWAIGSGFDAIFCRNVMIYFDKDTQYKILTRFSPMLAPHGLLFAGHSESLNNAEDLFKLRGHTVFEKA